MSTVLNARGIPLSYSAAADRHISIVDGGERHGTPQNDTFWGNAAVSVTLRGGAGDDVYHLYSGSNRAVEAADQGIDTVQTWMSYRLPDHIENLTVTGGGRFAFGNAADNIVTGGPGRQFLFGGAGDDVLKGGAGSDLFLIEKGAGSDLILDFSDEDVLRLGGTEVTSFAQLRAAMTQVGDDLRLDLGDGEILVLADTSRAELHAGQFQLALDRSTLSLSFEDGFDSLDLWDGVSGTWDSNYWWGAENGTSLSGNNELQWYIDHDFGPTRSADPFSLEDGVLTITAASAEDEIRPLIDGYAYTSGMLTSYESFAQTYGYFEVRADLPEARGLWPAFWMLPADGSWPPELDIIETIGQQPNRLILTAHSNASGSQTSSGATVPVPSTAGFHDYGVLWDPEHIVWYFDGVEVARSETPSDMHQPMYLVMNLGVGGIAGEPVLTQGTLGEMKVDHLRAYALDGLIQAPQPGLAVDDTIVGGAGADILLGGAGDDLLAGKAGGDRLYGQAGDDLLRGNAGLDAFHGGPGNDTVDFAATRTSVLVDLAAGRVKLGVGTETLESIENAIGSFGADTLAGDAGDNRLVGGHGRDRLNGRQGDDSLTGGTAGDTFVFGRLDRPGGDGDDRIADFQRGGDRLAFRDLADSDGDGERDLDDLLAAVSSVTDHGIGKTVIVAFDNGASVTFEGRGTGQVASLTDLVKDAETQLLIW